MVHCKHQYILKISLLGNGKRAKDATMAVANELLQMPPLLYSFAVGNAATAAGSNGLLPREC